MAPLNDELNAELDPEAIRVGATIRALREAYGLKVTELARAVEISRPYLANVEAGRKHAPRTLCAQIARVLDVPLAAIVSSTYRDYADAGVPDGIPHQHDHSRGARDHQRGCRAPRPQREDVA